MASSDTADRANNDVLNREVERIANITLHDGVSVDEHDPEKLSTYARMVNLDACGISGTDERRSQKALDIVCEALLYRKMRNSAGPAGGSGNGRHNPDGSILDRGSEFGAGFS